MAPKKKTKKKKPKEKPEPQEGDAGDTAEERDEEHEEEGDTTDGDEEEQTEYEEEEEEEDEDGGGREENLFSKPKGKKGNLLKGKKGNKGKPLKQTPPKAKEMAKGKGKEKPLILKRGNKGGIAGVAKRGSKEKGGFVQKIQSFKLGKELSFTAGSKRKKKTTNTASEEGAAVAVTDASARAHALGRILKQRYSTSMMLCVLGFLAFSAAAAEQQALWALENEPDAACQGLKQVVSLFSVISIFFILRKHRLFIEQQKLMGFVPMDASTLTSGHIRAFAFEIVFNLIHAPPFFHMTFKYKVGTNENIFAFYSLDALMTIFIACRSYHIIELLYVRLHIQESQSKLAQRIGGTITMGPHFVAKLLLKNDPLNFVFALSFFSCCLLAYMSWVFERAYCAPWAEQYDHEELIIERCSLKNIDRAANIGSSLWGMMNVMTTLGGDLPPLTIMGRLISTLGVFVGLALLGWLLSAVTLAMTFSIYEKKVYGNMKYQSHTQKRYGKAAQLIAATWLRYKAMIMEKGGFFCASTSYRQARAMGYFCRSLHEFRQLTVIEKRTASLLRADKFSKQASVFVSGNEGDRFGGGGGGSTGPNDEEYRKIVQEEVKSGYSGVHERLDRLEQT
jgi:hypothetical protein